jgi:glycine/D-amino acid oxidase-like deaminating enzyme
VRPESGGYLVSGCDGEVMEACDPAPAAGAAGQLADKLARVAPPLAELGVARVWACLRTFSATAERRPVIGWDGRVPWLFWVAGLGGHGATASPAIGEEAARGILARVPPR